MRNLYFGDAAAQLYGVYGPPGGDLPRRRAVLLCHPLGSEYMYAHRALSRIARRLCDVGLHVLRFDYYATGDSAGGSGAGSVAHWLRDVHAATDELRELSGLAEVTLFGLRAGATLAAIASRDRDDVAELVLWDPLVDGQAWSPQADAPHVAHIDDLIAPSGRPAAPRIVLLQSGASRGNEPNAPVRTVPNLEIRRLPANNRWGADTRDPEPLMPPADGFRIVLDALAGPQR